MSQPQSRSEGALTPDLVAGFAAIVGAQHALTDPDQQLPYLREWRDLYNGRACVVLRPGSTEEVSRVLTLANEHGLPVVPQAGNTGLVGGQVAMHGEVLLSVGRLKRVRSLDPQGFTMTVEAGLTLAEAQAAADDADRLFPLSLPSEGSCQIGGNLATNAGGVGVLAYGNARQLVLGLEVVLADGRVWNGLNRLKKDNTGYDLKDLFIGSEGTLGVITAAVLKLFPKPAEKATSFVALADLDAALALFSLGQEIAGPHFTAFEVMARIVLETVVSHVEGARNPLPGSHPWYALLETCGLKADGTAERLLTDTLTAASERGIITDAVIASSLTQARDLWRLRESYSEAQKPLGGSVKNDVSVPVAAIPEFIRRADAAMERICPGARPIPISHFGDGNVHYNVSQPEGMAKDRFMALWDDMVHAVNEIVLDLNGSISAEHGIGVMKRAELARAKGPLAMDLMRKIKAVFDPRGILNPGKVL
ncbi:MAG: FAD-binding oxidoreductase [Hyphomicrobiaceae bacterium]|nr:FAD-binding oxidoreductase [Hyphomicrobiaceae bacterium]